MTEPTKVFPTGATRGANDNKLSYKGFLSPIVLKRYAEYMHRARLRDIPEGQTIRQPDNWKKGIDKEHYADSLVRHTVEFWEALERKWPEQGSEALRDTLCAIMFNAMGYLYEDLK